MLSLLRLERKQTNSSNAFRIRIFLLLSYTFEIETINMFIHSTVPWKTINRIETKMSKVYTRFRTKTAQEPYPMGGTYLYGLYKGVPPPPGYSKRRILCFYQDQTVDILSVLVSSRKGSRIELKFPLTLVTLIIYLLNITKDLLNLLTLELEERSLTCFLLTQRWFTKRGEWGGECSLESYDLSNFIQNKSTKLTFLQSLKKLESRVQTMPKNVFACHFPPIRRTHAQGLLPVYL